LGLKLWSTLRLVISFCRWVVPTCSKLLVKPARVALGMYDWILAAVASITFGGITFFGKGLRTRNPFCVLVEEGS
jgi:hypothetical protein